MLIASNSSYSVPDSSDQTQIYCRALYQSRLPCDGSYFDDDLYSICEVGESPAG